MEKTINEIFAPVLEEGGFVHIAKNWNNLVLTVGIPKKKAWKHAALSGGILKNGKKFIHRVVYLPISDHSTTLKFSEYSQRLLSDLLKERDSNKKPKKI